MWTPTAPRTSLCHRTPWIVPGLSAICPCSVPRTPQPHAPRRSGTALPLEFWSRVTGDSPPLDFAAALSCRGSYETGFPLLSRNSALETGEKEGWAERENQIALSEEHRHLLLQKAKLQNPWLLNWVFFCKHFSIKSFVETENSYMGIYWTLEPMLSPSFRVSPVPDLIPSYYQSRFTHLPARSLVFTHVLDVLECFSKQKCFLPGSLAGRR